jgi:hypothetical protein
MSSLLKTLIDKQKVQQPVAEAPKAEPVPLVERKAKTVISDGVAIDMAPNHDPEHPNHSYRQALLKRLKARNADVYDKIMSWD